MRNQCFFCGNDLSSTTYSRDGFTLLVPPSKGGKREPANLVPCCASCRSSKGAKTLEEYRLYMHRKTPVGAMHLALGVLESDGRLCDQDRAYIHHVRDLVTPAEPLVFPGERWA